MIIDNFLLPINIDNKPYYSIKQFATMTNHSEASVKQLIKRGNKFRKLKAIQFSQLGKVWLIPTEEFTSFVFTQIGPKSGTGAQLGYKYHKSGTVYEVALTPSGNILGNENTEEESNI